MELAQVRMQYQIKVEECNRLQVIFLSHFLNVNKSLMYRKFNIIKLSRIVKLFLTPLG